MRFVRPGIASERDTISARRDLVGPAVWMLTSMAKALMGLQAVWSLLTVAVVAARAVNILS